MVAFLMRRYLSREFTIEKDPARQVSEEREYFGPERGERGGCQGDAEKTSGREYGEHEEETDQIGFCAS